MKIALVPVTPIGTSTGAGFVHRASGCRLERITTPRYPAEHVEAGEKLARFRADLCDLSIREAARAVGLEAAHISGLEHGRHTFATEADRVLYLDTLRTVAGHSRIA